MPGGRLTQTDRQLIAAGLIAGLGFAEIARRLGKPTSTISREVGRNGGTTEYRAERAHLATAQRARRPRTARHPAALPPPVAELSGRDAVAVRDFRERFAGLLADTGLPRMAARVLACLIVADSGTLTSTDLVEHLRVSPASVSKAIAYLAKLAVVRRERVPRGRHERYTVDDDVWLRTWTGSARTNLLWAHTAREGADLLDPTTAAGARLDRMSTFFARLTEPAAVGLDDGLTVLAALVHAGRPMCAEGLAVALDWGPERVVAALRDAERRPDVTDPVVLRAAAPGTYTARAAPGRLTDGQRQSLNGGSP